MDVIIREATKDDIPTMLGLVRELAAFEKAADAVTVTEEHMADAAFGEDPVWFGWVAERTDTPVVVGIAMCYERYSTWKGRILYLEDIVVSEEVRSIGIGQELFDACIQYCVEKQYPMMTWQVLDWNEGAIRFYERNGASLDPEWLNGKLTLEQMRSKARS